MYAIDLHQHLWPAPLVEQLRRRTRAPYLRGWQLVIDGEPTYEIQWRDHEIGNRIELDRLAGIGLACVSLSAPLGIESLPRDEAGALLDAWHDGALELPAHFAAWASVPTEEPDLAGLAGLLDGPMVGVQLPATAVGSPEGWYAAGEVLRVAELADKPVFIHPGPAAASRGVPSWWAPVVGYVAQLQAAWWAWHSFGGRAQFPRLRLVFAAGAGLAPVHHERLAARGGSFGPVDPDVFVDTSSYGVQGLDALVRALGHRRPRAGQRPAVCRAHPLAPRRGRDAGGPRLQPAPGAGWTAAHRPRHRTDPTDHGGRGMTVTVLGVPARAATPLAGDLTLDTLPGRDLDQDELRSLASYLALRPELWQHHLAFDAENRVYVSLYRDAHVDIWLLCWTPENDTGFHDHDTSSGAVAVVSGTLLEHNLAIDNQTIETAVPGGQVFSFGPDHIHRLTGVDHGSVSVHAYSPPLWRMGRYSVGTDGRLRRQSVSYADELRPVD